MYDNVRWNSQASSPKSDNGHLYRPIEKVSPYSPRRSPLGNSVEDGDKR